MTESLIVESIVHDLCRNTLIESFIMMQTSEAEGKRVHNHMSQAIHSSQPRKVKELPQVPPFIGIFVELPHDSQ